MTTNQHHTEDVLDRLQSWVNTKPNHTAFHYIESDRTTSISYQKLWNRAQGIAQKLQQTHKGGARILLLYPPGLDFISALIGCLMAGMIAVPAIPPDLHTRGHHLSRLRLLTISENAQISAVLSTRSMLRLLNLDQLKQKIGQTIAGWWQKNKKKQLTQQPFWQVPRIATDTIKSTEGINITRHPIALLQYTSGSTTAPKGVIISHENISNNINNILEITRKGNKIPKSAVNWLPTYHDMGLINGVLLPLYAGIPSSLMSPLYFLQQPLAWLQCISTQQAVISGGPNFAYALCTRKITDAQKKSLDLSQWHIAYTGSETVQAHTLDQFSQAFAAQSFDPDAFYPCYGLAEATVFVSGRALTTPIQIRPDPISQKPTVSLGQCFADHELRIIDPDKKTDCKSGVCGEIWLRGPSVATGYWHKETLSEQTFHATTADGAGPFLRTGDLGYLMDDHLYFHSRLKDQLVIRGRSYSPSDIEWAVSTHCAFARPGSIAAVEYILDNTTYLGIVCELNTKHPAPSAEYIIEQIRGCVARECHLNTFVILCLPVKHVPKTANGKIMRHACQTLLTTPPKTFCLYCQQNDTTINSSQLSPYLQRG